MDDVCMAGSERKEKRSGEGWAGSFPAEGVRPGQFGSCGTILDTAMNANFKGD